MLGPRQRRLSRWQDRAFWSAPVVTSRAPVAQGCGIARRDQRGATGAEDATGRWVRLPAVRVLAYPTTGWPEVRLQKVSGSLGSRAVARDGGVASSGPSASESATGSSG